MAMWRKTREAEVEPQAPVMTPAFEPVSYSPEPAEVPIESVAVESVPVIPVGPTTDIIDPRVELASDEVDPDAPPVKRRRSGRNLVVATIVGLAMFAGVLTAVWFHPLALALIVYGASIGAIIEWRRALGPQGRRIPLLPVLAATIGMGVATWNGLAEGLGVALLVGCVGVVAWRVADERIENTLADSLASIMTLLWIPFLASFFMLMVQADGGWMRVFVVILAIVGNDTGALFAGMKWGKHKLAPRVSPSKTWEGGVGGVLLGTAAATVASYYFFDGRWWLGVLVGLASTVAAIVGDLAESVVKRDIQIKDMSGAIPGHGGIMDRLDSALFAAPAAYLVFAIVLGTT